MQRSQGEQAQLIRQAIEQGGLERIDAIQQAIKDTQALEYTMDKARTEAQLAVNALQVLPDSDYKTALESLSWLAVNRSH